MKNFKEREWNYYLEVGDKVKICDDGPPKLIENLSKWKPEIKKCLDKIGIVRSCYSDLHAFCCGYLWRVEVDFEGITIDTSTQILIKID